MILSDTPTAAAPIAEICRNAASSCGFTLVEAVMQGKSLEVTIFHPQRDLSLHDCEQVSRRLHAQLEAQHPAYLDRGLSIEVQSPGIERRLKTYRDFEVFTGKTIEITLANKIFDLSDCFTCRLLSFDGKSITVGELAPLTVASAAAEHHSNKAAVHTTTLPQSLTLDLAQVNTVKLYQRRKEH